MNSKALFSKTSPAKLFFLAAIPGAISMLASSLYGLFDGIFVGRLLGDTAFAALNLAFPFVIINFALADLIGVGSSVPISIKLGENKDKEASNYFTCACIMIFIAGIVMGALLYFAAPFLISVQGAKGTLASLAVKYIRVYAVFSPVTTITFAMDNYLRICGKIRSSMALNIFMSAFTVLLEFLFLFVLQKDVEGAALAACLGMLAASLIAFIPFAAGKMLLKFTKPKFSLHLVKYTISGGVPAFLSNIAGRVTSILMNTTLLSLGGQDAVSVYGVLMYTGDMVQPIFYGLCDALQPAVSFNYGAGRKDRSWAIEKYCFASSALVSLAAAAIVFIFPQQIAALFLGSDKLSLVSDTAFALRIFGFSFFTRWFATAAQSCLTAFDRPFAASALSLCNAFLFPIILLALLYPFGLVGIWLNFPIACAMVALLAASVLLIGKKK